MAPAGREKEGGREERETEREREDDRKQIHSQFCLLQGSKRGRWPAW
jgi:hypothetical protein